MLHLSLNEFCSVEREQKLATLLWPDWHYGVLSMYATHLAINHLTNGEKLDIRNGNQLLDQLTTITDRVIFYSNAKNNNNLSHKKYIIITWRSNICFLGIFVVQLMPRFGNKFNLEKCSETLANG